MRLCDWQASMPGSRPWRIQVPLGLLVIIHLSSSSGTQLAHVDDDDTGGDSLVHPAAAPSAVSASELTGFFGHGLNETFSAQVRSGPPVSAPQPSRVANSPPAASAKRPGQQRGTEQVRSSTVGGGKIDSILSILKEIVKSIEDEGFVETQTFEQFKKWCDQEAVMIKSNLEQVDDQQRSSFVVAKEHEAAVSTLEHRLKEIGEAVGEISDVLEQAAGLRKSAKEQYAHDLNINNLSIDQVTNALRMLDTGAPERPQFLQAFLQGKAGVALRGHLQQPGESSFIVGILKQLKVDFEKAGAELSAQEKAQQDRYDALVHVKEQARVAFEEEKADKTDQLALARIHLLEAQRINNKAHATIETLNKLLMDTTEHCQAKSNEFKARYDDRVAEKQALNQAIDFIKSAATLQPHVLSASPVLQPEMEVGASSEDEVESVVDEAEGEDGLAFAQVAAVSTRGGARSSQRGGFPESMSTEPFDADGNRGKADNVVQQLILQLQATQKTDEEKTAFCVAELQAKGKAKADLDERLEALVASIQFKTSENRRMREEVKGLNATILKSKKGLVLAAAVRRNETAIYAKGSKDRKLAVKILMQAITSLQEFYKTQAKTDSSRIEAFEPRSTRKDLRSKQVIERITMVIADIEKEERQAANDEKEAVAAYEVLQEDTRGEFDNLMEEITIRNSQMFRHVVQLNSEKDERAQMETERQAIVDQIQALHVSCDILVANFRKDTEGRNFQISQLRDVADILAGSSEAVRTGK